MDRTTSFLARLDAYLAPMSRAQRQRRLREHLDAWELRYARFVRSEGECFPEARAEDFINTICGIAARMHGED